DAHAQEQAVARDAGVVDQEIEATLLLEQRLGELFDLCRVADVARHLRALAPRGGDRLQRRGAAAGARRRADDVGARARAGLRDRAADAARAAGDECDLTLQVHGCSPAYRCYQRITTCPHASPAPNAGMITSLPLGSWPCSYASLRAIGTDAADV